MQVATMQSSNSITSVNTGATSAPKTSYQTLVSVNSLDHEKFKEGDRLAVGKYWDKVFTQNNTSEEIYDAIACKGGSAAKNATIRSQASDCL